MKKSVLVGCIAVLTVAFVVYGQTTARPQQQAPAPAGPSGAAQRALLDQYCVTCHNDKAKIGGLSLEKLDVAHVGENPQLWEKVVRKLRAGVMPPPTVKRPEPASYEALASWLENEIDR